MLERKLDEVQVLEEAERILRTGRQYPELETFVPLAVLENLVRHVHIAADFFREKIETDFQDLDFYFGVESHYSVLVEKLSCGVNTNGDNAARVKICAGDISYMRSLFCLTSSLSGTDALVIIEDLWKKHPGLAGDGVGN